MNKLSKLFRRVILSAIACFVAIGLSTVSQSASQSAQSQQVGPFTMPHSMAHSVAQTMQQTRYVVALSHEQVMPTAPSSNASGMAEAMLMGDRLVVQGDFSNLSSPLRDYATDPLDPPNPNITSGVHIHQGTPTENGPFQYALEVSPGDSNLQGQFMGEYTLSQEQLQALANGNLYIDLHTQQNRAGELRGVFKPS